jgi:ribosome recycling factor
MTHPIVTETQGRMKKALDHAIHEFSTIRTGKASPAMVEGVAVQAYGTTMRLKDCAAITTPDPRLIQITPWDKSILRDVEKALQTANLGINPIVDGGVIRMPLPELSRERRQEFVKVAHKLAEEGRVSVRNARHAGMETAKKLQKEGKLAEDDLRRIEKEIQTITEHFIKDIDAHLAAKEKELTTV